MSRSHDRRRRVARKLRNAEYDARLVAERAKYPPVPTERKTFCFRARGGVVVTFSLDPEPVQSDGESLTSESAHARLLERALALQHDHGRAAENN